MVPRIAVTCPGSQGTFCPCSPFMTRVKVPGSSFMLCLGPGPSSLLHLTRANAEKPYAGDTLPVCFLLYDAVLYTACVRCIFTHKANQKKELFAMPSPYEQLLNSFLFVTLCRLNEKQLTCVPAHRKNSKRDERCSPLQTKRVKCIINAQRQNRLVLICATRCTGSFSCPGTSGAPYSIVHEFGLPWKDLD